MYNTVVLLVSILLSQVAMGIVNIEALVKKGENRPINLKANLSFQENNARSNFKTFGLGINFRYLTKIVRKQNSIKFRDRFFGTFSKNKAEKDRLLIRENNFYHLRYTRMLNQTFGLEAFIQNEKDLFNALERRNLSGLATRIDILIKHFRFVGGVGVLNEKEVVNIQQKTETETERVTTSVNLSFPMLKNTANFSLISYWQPGIKDFNDYRLLSTILMEFFLYKSFSLSLSYQLQKDTRPVSGVPKQTTTTLHQMSYRF